MRIHVYALALVALLTIACSKPTPPPTFTEGTTFGGIIVEVESDGRMTPAEVEQFKKEVFADVAYLMKIRGAEFETFGEEYPKIYVTAKVTWQPNLYDVNLYIRTSGVEMTDGFGQNERRDYAMEDAVDSAVKQFTESSNAARE